MASSWDETDVWTRRVDVLCSREWDFEEFFALLCIEREAFFGALRSTGSIALGRSLLNFVKAPEEFLEAQKFLRMDILYTGQRPATVLKKMLEDSGYVETRTKCRHVLGEWGRLPRGKVTCMVRGDLHGRVIHLVEVPASPVQVVLSRAYGSQCGTYLDGKGSLVSLFPDTTFLETRVWLPAHVSADGRRAVLMKYGIPEADEIPVEIDLSTRVPGDRFSLVVAIGTNGVGRVVQRPERAIGVVAGEKEAEMIQQYGQIFRTMRASSNAAGTLFDRRYWMWPGQSDL
jgi:hypothetical protein